MKINQKKMLDIIFNLTKNLNDTKIALDESNALIKKTFKRKSGLNIQYWSIGLEPKLYCDFLFNIVW